MLVRCINNDKSDGCKHDVTIGRVYAVLEVSFAGYEKHRKFVIQRDSDGYPCLFDFSLFEIDDMRVPNNWCLEPLDASYFGANSFDLGPKEFADYKSFWDKFHDDDDEAMRIFLEVLKKIWAFHGFEA